MTNFPLGDLIKYRIARASETLAEAKLMAKSGHWNTCINRLYYSCFYSVNALLIKHILFRKTCRCKILIQQGICQQRDYTC